MKKGIMCARPLCFGSDDLYCAGYDSCALYLRCRKALEERQAAARLEAAHALIRILLKENDELFNSLWTKCIQCDNLIDEAVSLKAALNESQDNMTALGLV